MEVDMWWWFWMYLFGELGERNFSDEPKPPHTLAAKLFIALIVLIIAGVVIG